MNKQLRIALALSAALAVSIAAAGCSFFKDRTAVAFEKGDLVVHSGEIAEVYVDGNKVGATNEPIDGLEPGERTITVKMADGEILLEKTVVVDGNAIVQLETSPETGDPDLQDAAADVAESNIEEEPEATAIDDLAVPAGSGADAKAAAAQSWSETIAKGTSYSTTLYGYDSGVPGPTVWVNGGVHGNEPAGYKSADNIRTWKVKKGRIIVVPRANKLAIAANKRYVSSTGDLNRKFPTTRTGKAQTYLARAIQDSVRKYDPDYLIDLHEGYDYWINKSTDSVGQTCIYYPEGSAKTIASKIVNNLNSGISSSSKKFHLLRYPVTGSLARWAGQGLDIPAFIFETASKVSLSTRITYHEKAVTTLLKHLGMA